MEDVNAVKISDRLGEIVAELTAIRVALEKLASQQDHSANNMTKRY